LIGRNGLTTAGTENGTKKKRKEKSQNKNRFKKSPPAPRQRLPMFLPMLKLIKL
jgi:hypothetical protein